MGTKNADFSRTVTIVEIFENASFSFTCERMKTEVLNTMMSYIITTGITHALLLCVCALFSYVRAKTRKSLSFTYTANGKRQIQV